MNDIQKMNMQKTIDNIVNEFRQMLENELLHLAHLSVMTVGKHFACSSLTMAMTKSRGY